MDNILSLINSLSMPLKLFAFAGIAALAHLVVVLLRFYTSLALGQVKDRRYQKLRSIVTLATSAVIFTLYFLTFGLILREFGVSLTAYLASASVIGLAIGFGSQGVVQDVVTGLTFIFSDLVDVGDMVEISGQTGVVKAITMRFVELENAMGATVFIPNRTINNVINYPRGYIRCIVDITLPDDAETSEHIENIAIRLMGTIRVQFPGIFVSAPSSEGRLSFGEDKQVLRLKFRIWPGRQQPLESAFREELIARISRFDTAYQPWMVAIVYEVETRVERPFTSWSWRKNKQSG